ncbi:MAG: DUF2807 domain-containing protein [Bacteroidota bacterium]
MKKVIHILIAFLVLSCGKEEDVVRTFELREFKKIEFDDSFQVVFHTSNDFRIIATGTERFTEDLDVIMDGDSVKVDNGARAAWLRPESNKVRLDIYCDSLSQIKANESCEMSTADTLRSKDLVVIVGSKLNIADLKVNCTVFGYYNVFPCSGIMTFSGKTNQLNIWNDALMEVAASNLKAENAFVENRSGSNCTINVSNSLQYSILNRGNILIQGNPLIIEEIDNSGEGDLVAIP